ncbi:hypothetical protein Q5P01_013284 [Channa striata]|uniref:Methyltransferase type 11 domain-containing protein n=1 Tax=Channa striata TaxID=64152 RepID=A0AA88MMK4_CHASR|nr:hypothetical protein Q5P01_013284 [Channa striata]
MSHRLFEGKEHATSYRKYRISPSDQLIQRVLDFFEKQRSGPCELAVDVGCGSGQGTVKLARHFASVVGTDVSAAQLEEASQHANEPNITYRQCAAEELPFADGSVDLVTAMSAFHWFDRPRFLQEAHRVLKPNGCLALLNYTLAMELSYPDCCGDTLNQVCQEFYAGLNPYRSPHLGAGSVDFIGRHMRQFLIPIKSGKVCGEDPQKAASLSQDFCHRLMSVMRVSSAETEVEVAVKYFYLLARKPQEA